MNAILDSKVSHDIYVNGVQDGREALAHEILTMLDFYPNNVERIDQIRNRCCAVLGLKEPDKD